MCKGTYPQGKNYYFLRVQNSGSCDPRRHRQKGSHERLMRISEFCGIFYLPFLHFPYGAVAAAAALSRL